MNITSSITNYHQVLREKIMNGIIILYSYINILANIISYYLAHRTLRFPSLALFLILSLSLSPPLFFLSLIHSFSLNIFIAAKLAVKSVIPCDHRGSDHCTIISCNHSNNRGMERVYKGRSLEQWSVAYQPHSQQHLRRAPET